MAKPSRSVVPLVALLCVLACLATSLPSGAAARLADLAPVAARTGSFTLFESGQVRPLALSPSGKRLFAVNTPDNRLEVFRVEEPRPGASRLRPGRPRAGRRRGAQRRRGLGRQPPLRQRQRRRARRRTGTSGRVVRTLLVGDEPRDIVFAGPGRNRAFITTAHRGQNVPYDPQLTTAGVGRADVWVFDANSLGSDARRHAAHHRHALRRHAARARGDARTAARSTRRRSTPATGPRPSPRSAVPDGWSAADGVPGTRHRRRRPPRARRSGSSSSSTAPTGSTSSAATGTTRCGSRCPTRTSSRIDANANPPAQLGGAAGFYRGVGTILFNMAVNPVNGKVYVSNTEAGNEERFEGPGDLRRPQRARPPPREPDHRARPGRQRRPAAPQQAHRLRRLLRRRSRTPRTTRASRCPQQMAVTSDGRTLYVAALGSTQDRRLRHRARSRATRSCRAPPTRSR